MIWETLRHLALTGILLLVATYAGSPLTTWVFSRVDRKPTTAGSPDQTDRPVGVTDAEDILRGGHWIGLLERIAVFTAVLFGWHEGVLAVLALKGLGRYPELRGATPGTAERFIIGTFTSILFATAMGILARWTTQF